MFLITGFGASGTKYTSEVFKKLKYDVGHEKLGKVGTVSWKHLPDYKKFDKVLHQHRHPLKVINSGITGNIENWKWMATHFNTKPNVDPNKGRLIWIMWLYYEWTMWAETVCDISYKIETFDKGYKKIFRYLKLKAPKKLPNIAKDFNTHSKKKSYGNFSWINLVEEDVLLANKIQELAESLGYALQ